MYTSEMGEEDFTQLLGFKETAIRCSREYLSHAKNMLVKIKGGSPMSEMHRDDFNYYISVAQDYITEIKQTSRMATCHHVGTHAYCCPVCGMRFYRPSEKGRTEDW